MKNRLSLLSTALLVSAFACIPTAAQAAQHTQVSRELASPNGEISLTFKLADGAPSYSVNFKKQAVLRPSALGFEFKNGSMKSDFFLTDAKTSSKDETW